MLKLDHHGNPVVTVLCVRPGGQEGITHVVIHYYFISLCSLGQIRIYHFIGNKVEQLTGSEVVLLDSETRRLGFNYVVESNEREKSRRSVNKYLLFHTLLFSHW